MLNDIILQKIAKKLSENGFANIEVREKLGGVWLKGELDNYQDIVKCGKLAVTKKHSRGVINDIRLKGQQEIPMSTPNLTDKKYEGRKPDVLIIGGGIVGAAIARELSKFNLDIILAEKEYDLATAQSSRNDGMIHAGIDLKPNSKKVKYNMRGNRLYDTISKELDLPIRKVGQYVLFTSWMHKLLFPLIKIWASFNKIPVKYCSAKYIKDKIKSPGFDFGGIFCAGAGILNPFLTTIAFAESAIQNGVELALNTAVLNMKNDGKRILFVNTNRGTIYPKVVINAAGVFSDKISEMAGDRFFTIHPRKGVEAILDKKANHLTNSVIGKFVTSTKKEQTKGGGIVRTIDENILVGPTSSEVYERENYQTSKEEMDALFGKQGRLNKDLNKSDIITYFSGTRAPNYEEEFIVEKSPVISNLVVAAGIQSPGITCAPAIAEDIAKFTIEILNASQQVSKNLNFVAQRKSIPSVKDLTDEERQLLIKNNPDYGIIICRCEEISKGEIIDALKGNIPISTIDSIKRRVRPGMGRCQGGFCSPLITKIISEELNIPLEDVNKKGLEGSIIMARNKEKL